MEALTPPEKIIGIMKVMLAELERWFETAPQVDECESAQTTRLQNQIDRLDVVLKKRQAADRRKSEIDRDNKRRR